MAPSPPDAASKKLDPNAIVLFNMVSRPNIVINSVYLLAQK